MQNEIECMDKGMLNDISLSIPIAFVTGELGLLHDLSLILDNLLMSLIEFILALKGG